MKRFNSLNSICLAAASSLLMLAPGPQAAAADALFLQLGQAERIPDARYQKFLAAEPSAAHPHLDPASLLEDLDAKLADQTAGEPLSLIYIQDANEQLETHDWLLPAMAERLRGRTDQNTVVLIDLAERAEVSAHVPISRLALSRTRDLLTDGHVFYFRPEFGKSFEKKLKTASVAVGMIPGMAVGLTKITLAHQFDFHSFWLAVESSFPVSAVAKGGAIALFAKARYLRAETLREGSYIRYAHGQPAAQSLMRPGYAKLKLAELRERARYAHGIKKRVESARFR